MQFIPIVERDNDTGYQEGEVVTERSITAAGYGQFLIDMYEEWVRRDVGRVFVQIFDIALAAWTGAPPGLCVFDETCGLAMAMEHSGVSSLGRPTTVQPAANAGAHFRDASKAGKFQAVMLATTPTGCWMTR